MKAVMLSIKPKYCKLIASGRKIVELRKTRPKIETPFKCYIYCTKDKTPFFLPTYSKGNLTDSDIWQKGNGKVIGEFDCNIIEGGYLISPFCAWHISDLVIYDKPKELSEFRKPLICHRGIQNDNCVGCWDCEIKRPPQSWFYVEEV